MREGKERQAVRLLAPERQDNLQVKSAANLLEWLSCTFGLGVR